MLGSFLFLNILTFHIDIESPVLLKFFDAIQKVSFPKILKIGVSFENYPRLTLIFSSVPFLSVIKGDYGVWAISSCLERVLGFPHRCHSD